MLRFDAPDRNRSARRLAWLPLILLAPAPGWAPLLAQERDRESAAPVEYESTETFTSVTGLARLPDGRLVVTDNIERRIVVLDPETGGTTDIGRTGDGPREFGSPFAPIERPDGSVWVYDAGNARYLEIGPAGDVIGSVPWRRDETTGGRWPTGGADADGRIYWTATPPFDQKGPATTGWIVAWDPDEDRPAGSTDRLPRLAEVTVRDSEGRLILRPLVTHDGWAVNEQGDIAIVRSDEPRIEWLLADGTTVTGPHLEMERFPIDDRELAAVDEGMNQGARSSVSAGSREGSAEVRRLSPEWVTPDVLPPFEADRVFARGRTVWVERRMPADFPDTIVMRFGEDGRPLRDVRLPGDVDLLRVGEGRLYGVSTDDLGLQRIRIYGIPRG